MTPRSMSPFTQEPLTWTPLAGLVPPRPLLPHVMAFQTSLAPAHAVWAASRVASRSPAVALAPWLPAAWALASAQLVQGRQPCLWLRVLFWLLACALRSSLPLGGGLALTPESPVPASSPPAVMRLPPLAGCSVRRFWVSFRGPAWEEVPSRAASGACESVRQ